MPSRMMLSRTFALSVTLPSPNGSALAFSTFLGGSGDDVVGDLVLDRKGGVYIIGSTGSSDFPVTAGAFQTSCGAGCGLDGFVSKLKLPRLASHS